MKKNLIFILSLMIIWTLSFGTAIESSAKTNNTQGKVIKGKNISTLYYVGDNGKRYVFPNAKIYFSWFGNFNEVVEVEQEELYDYPLGGNVRYKPGVVLVKIQTNPKVYAVGNNGKLRWVKTEKLAKHLYGSNWNLLIDDVPDSFFTNYEIDDPIDEESDFDPEEEEEENPTINHNLGFKHRLIFKIQESIQEKRCQRLGKYIKRVQKRLARFGIEADDLGGDYLEECFDEDRFENKYKKKKRWKWYKNNKINICHIPPGDPENSHTISVSLRATRAHLAHGDYLGKCETGQDDDDQDEVDTTPPIISEINSNPSASTNVISWITDEKANSVVEYASEPLDQATITTIINKSDYDTTHELTLENLTSSTTYYFIIKSTDEEGNTATTTEHQFATEKENEEADTTPPIISEVSAEEMATSTIITWETDEGADSVVEYANEPLDQAATTTITSESDYVTAHELTLENLTSSTTYYYIVRSTDEEGNTASTTEHSFTTEKISEEPDTTAPIISEVSVEEMATSTTIAWETDENADSVVIYADESLDTASTTISKSDDNLTLSHSITLNDLATSTEYFFRVESSDAEGNIASTSEESFTTLSE